jgi:hypothetical protein
MTLLRRLYELRLRQKQEVWGRAGFAMLWAGLAVAGLNIWQGIDFLAEKRSGILSVLALVGQVVLSPEVGWVLGLGGAGLLTFLWRQARRDLRELNEWRRSVRIDATVTPEPVGAKVRMPSATTVASGPNGLSNWEVRVQWGGDAFVPGQMEDIVLVRAVSTDGSREKVLSCVVTAPDGRESSVGELELGSAIFGSGLERLMESDDTLYFYPDPREFKNPPPTPLVDGTYRVAFYAKTKDGPGQFLLAADRFGIRDGRLI